MSNVVAARTGSRSAGSLAKTTECALMKPHHSTDSSDSSTTVATSSRMLGVGKFRKRDDSSCLQDLLAMRQLDNCPSRLQRKHGRSGSNCAGCGRWKWMPLSEDMMLAPTTAFEGVVAASNEWFGDGGMAYRETTMCDGLASLTTEASPRDFWINEWPAGEGGASVSSRASGDV